MLPIQNESIQDVPTYVRWEDDSYQACTLVQTLHIHKVPYVEAVRWDIYSYEGLKKASDGTHESSLILV